MVQTTDHVKASDWNTSGTGVQTRTPAPTTSLMTTSYRRTRPCVWGEKTTTAASLRSPCRKAADSGALIHSIQLNAPLLSALTPDRELGSYTTRVYSGWCKFHSPSLLPRWCETRILLWAFSPRRRSDAVCSLYLRGVPVSSEPPVLVPPSASLVLSSPTSSAAHIHTHTKSHTLTGGGAQHHSRACARPLRALQRHDRCMVAWRHWTIWSYYPNRHAHTTWAM